MINPDDLRFTQGFNRYYRHPENLGESYKSVTSIIDNNLSKGGLHYWTADETVKYAMRNIERLEFGKTIQNEREREFFIKDFRRDALDSYSATFKRDIGTAVHDLVEALLKGFGAPSIPDHLFDKKGAIEVMAKQVIRFLHENDMETVLCEAVVYNNDAMYAGTLDYLGKYQDEYFIMDIKTGKVFPDAATQIAAYAMSDQILNNDGEIISMPEVTRGIILQPNAEAGLNVIPIDLYEAKRRWVNCVSLEQFQDVWSNNEYVTPSLDTDWV